MKTIIAPPSKSYSHRMMICAALADGKSILKNYSTSDDMEATLKCISAFGASYSVCGDELTIEGCGGKPINNANSCDIIYNCNESGSTLRFFIPIAMALSHGGKFTGSSRLIERGISIYEEIFDSSVQIKKSSESIQIQGDLSAKEYKLRGNVSSQFITGLLFALPLLKNDSTITITTELESAAYIDITIEVLKLYGIKIEKKSESQLFIPGNQIYKAQNLSIEGDWSNAAPFFALGIPVEGLNNNSRQGDKVCVSLFKQIKAEKSDIDISNCPDLGPILFAYAAVHGGTTFTGTARLKIKECDRAQAMKDELFKFGIPVTINENSVIIEKAVLQPPTVPLLSHNDHRIVMAMTYLSLHTGGTIEGINAINKSFPTFFEKLRTAGINIGEPQCNCLKIQKF